MKKIFLISFFLLLIFLPNLTSGAGLVPCGGPDQDPCTFCHLFIMFNSIIEFVMFKIVPPLAVLMMVVGGIMFFFGGASPEILSRAKSIIISVVIGLAIVFCAWIIVDTILVQSGLVEQEIGGHPWTWWNITCE